MQATLDLPIAISLIGGRFFLFSADVVSYLRREYRICGVLIGSIPQIPQQNVFLGLPLELMPEEAQLLVDKEVAYIVDDVRAHEEGLHSLDQSRRRDYLASLQKAGEKAAKSQAEVRGQNKEQALKKLGLTPRSNGTESDEVLDSDGILQPDDSTKVPPEDPTGENDSLFTPPVPPSKSKSNKSIQSSALAITPATSHALLPTPPPPPPGPLDRPHAPLLPVKVPSSYPLFAHLHAQSYFLSPGLRFGCQYVVYPGDPLRFHSHFLAMSVAWEGEINLLAVVGGGRLGTGVKKGYLLGGQEPASGEVRTFSVEWAVM